MITGELKSKVDRIWDTMCSGGISNPLSVIEQLTPICCSSSGWLANVVDQLDAIDMADQDTKAKIAANDDDLSINRYQEVTYEAEGRRWPARSMRKRSGITCVAIWTTS
ncbi:hypothetical protein [Nitrosomonas sp. Nm132]|uniref:hypothetical protein n=1 Tax=Nitrosomonas sp. Nm132 TaxID=1881053 RepID=UPI001C40B42F|nr:hypothetical protein [Nitrosomonas sp. Nm132]